MPDASLESRLAAVEDELAIRNLVASYVFAIDDHDLETVADLFTADAVFASKDKVMNATGRDAIVEQFKGRFKALGISNHVAHDVWVKIESPTRGRGRVSLHAELVRHGKPYITALRYEDIYSKDEGKWRFKSRQLSFLYYCAIDEFLDVFTKRDRNRAYGKPAPADFPEGLPSWERYPPATVAA